MLPLLVPGRIPDGKGEGRPEFSDDPVCRRDFEKAIQKSMQT